MPAQEFPHDKFDDLLDANAEYQKTFKYSDLTGQAKRGLAIVTCMDSRISPLAVVGMQAGDAKILRNARLHADQPYNQFTLTSLIKSATRSFCALSPERFFFNNFSAI